MNRSFRLFLCGLLPAVMGFTLSLLLQSYAASGQTWTALGLFGVVFWAFAGWKLSSPRERPWQTTALVHLPALVAWGLAMYQILLRGAWFSNALGGVSQSFFLPFLTPAMALAALFPTDSLWPAFTLAFAVMLLSFWLGACWKQRRYQKKR